MAMPAIARSFLSREAYGWRMRILPRSPMTRCQGMPFPEGVAAMARPALRAPPGRRKALARAPYVKTRPRGICFTKRNTGSQVIANQAPRRDGENLVRHARCPPPEEQEKNGPAGFDGIAGLPPQNKNHPEDRKST